MPPRRGGWGEPARSGRRGGGNLVVIIILQPSLHEVEKHWDGDGAVVVREDLRVDRIGEGLIIIFQHQGLNHFQDTLLEFSWECRWMEMFWWVSWVWDDRIPRTDSLVVPSLSLALLLLQLLSFPFAWEWRVLPLDLQRFPWGVGPITYVTISYSTNDSSIVLVDLRRLLVIRRLLILKKIRNKLNRWLPVDHTATVVEIGGDDKIRKGGGPQGDLKRNIWGSGMARFAKWAKGRVDLTRTTVASPSKWSPSEL
jgi:hypothetical protein